MDIALNINTLLTQLKGTDCKLIAISKTKSVPEILQAYQAGHRIFGENKVQELTAKHEELPGDIEWHMVGHLQSNKVKYIAPFIALIHAVDSFKLLREINKQGRKNNRVISCLLQVHIAEEETKFGLSKEELFELLMREEIKDLDFMKIKGLMGMATFTDDEDKVRREFRFLKGLFEEIRNTIDVPNVEMRELSMGMTDDYRIAIEEGSTMVRIGTAIFGERNCAI